MTRIDAIASLFLRLDRGSATFLQQQICEGLRRAISDGVLGSGTRLPSTRVLAAELAVSRTTIVAALHRLVEEGYLTPRELRLGYLVAPRGLADGLRAARATMEEPLPSRTQLALADFITEGHFVRHLRRMKVLYRRRCEALVAAARGRLKIRPVAAGLQAVADLPPGVDAVAVSAAAARRGVEAAPLSQFHADGRSSPATLVLGFGAVDPDRARAAMDKLVAAIDEVARRQAS